MALLELDNEPIEQQLLKIDECFVYRVGPRKSANRGHRADEWGLDNPLLTAELKARRPAPTAPRPARSLCPGA